MPGVTRTALRESGFRRETFAKMFIESLARTGKFSTFCLLEEEEEEEEEFYGVLAGILLCKLTCGDGLVLTSQGAVSAAEPHAGQVL